jgi:hypothetical protein
MIYDISGEEEVAVRNFLNIIILPNKVMQRANQEPGMVSLTNL